MASTEDWGEKLLWARVMEHNESCKGQRVGSASEGQACTSPQREEGDVGGELSK